MTTETLSTEEAATLERCEAVIERGLVAFLEVGDAMLEIRDNRLYRLTHGSFEDYCRERWGWGRNYASKLIAAAEVTHILDAASTSLGTMVPRNPIPVARALTPLKDDPDALLAAFQETMKLNGDNPTRAQTKEVVDDLMRTPLRDDQIKETHIGDAMPKDPLPPEPITDLQEPEIEEGVRALERGWAKDLERIYLRTEEEMEFRAEHGDAFVERHHVMLRRAHDRIIEALPDV